MSQRIAVLEGLLEQYQLNYERRKTVRLVAQALASRRMHLFKVSPQESDLDGSPYAPSMRTRAARIRAMSTRSSGSCSRNSSRSLSALDISVSRGMRGGRCSPVIREANSAWVQAHAADINRAANQLSKRGEYVPGRDVDYTSLVPDLHSPENERPWVAINALPDPRQSEQHCASKGHCRSDRRSRERHRQ